MCLAMCLATAQTPEPAKPAASPAGAPSGPAAKETKPPVIETPPDIKAITEANKIADPEKKIEAYQKIKKDFPKSTGGDAADSMILSTLIKKMPDQRARIQKQAQSNYRAAAAKERGSEAYGIATEFLNAGILLNDAEGYAKKSVQSMVLANYLQEEAAGYKERKQNPPSTEELHKRFRENRAGRVAVLGRIELKLGKTAQGQKLLEEVYAVTRDNGLADAALGELAAKAGDDSKALEYLIPARLSGKAPDTAIAAMDAIYRKRAQRQPGRSRGH
ncbi:MAG TPA: hypothetical protein VNY05_39225, partial [Candidatus Acidoferrales bacterium]|nr:hypothetical protein [Candidatus Acidoferrales bacterium]